MNLFAGHRPQLLLCSKLLLCLVGAVGRAEIGHVSLLYDLEKSSYDEVFVFGASVAKSAYRK